MPAPQLNLVSAWIGILLGFVSGFVLGLFFHRENWLGGYASPQRRFYRLAHISLFGLGAANLLFYLTARSTPPGGLLEVASWAFVAGAVTMPICCVLMAHAPRSRACFVVPVLSLVTGALLTLVLVLKQPHPSNPTLTGAASRTSSLNLQPPTPALP